MKKTIKELADEFSISKTAIRKRMTDEFRAEYTETINGVIYISETGCELIAETILKTPETIQETIPGTPETFAETMQTTDQKPQTQYDDLIQLLKNTIASLENQLTIKDKQIEELNSRLSEASAALLATQSNLTESQQALMNAQALHAADKYLEDKEQRNSFWHKIFKKKG